MTKLISNFKHDLKYKNIGVFCVSCGTEEEVNTHVMECKHYEDLRQGLDFSNNEDLANESCPERRIFYIRTNNKEGV